MATAISALPVLPSPADTDIYPVVQGGITYQATRTQIVSGIDTSLQTQITSNDGDITNLQNQKLDIAGDTMTGDLVLSGAPTINLHAATKLYVDTADALRLDLAGAGTMTGDLDMGTNSINNVVDPAAAQDAATQNYVITTTAKILEAYSPVATSAFPTTYGGEAITDGDRFNVTAAGTLDSGSVTVQIGDVLEALTNTPGDTSANWSITNANTVTSSETVAGIIETATDAEAVAKSASTAIVASNLATGNFQASATFEGLIELATAGEFSTGTDTTRGITPAIFNTSQTDYEQFMGIDRIVFTSAGTFTATTSGTAGDIYSSKTAAADAPNIVFDISQAIRTTADRGLQLNSFDVIYKIGTAALNSFAATLITVNFTDASAAVPTQATPAITGTLSLTTSANIRVTNHTVDTPDELNTTVAKHMILLAVNAAATSVLDVYGINLKFAKSGI
jgi:hypothetical protein